MTIVAVYWFEDGRVAKRRVFDHGLECAHDRDPRPSAALAAARRALEVLFLVELLDIQRGRRGISAASRARRRAPSR